MAVCYNRYTRQQYYCNSNWTSWGRWVLLGVIVFAAIFFFFCMSCFTARRRRKAGAKPLYGTGWAAPGGSYQPNYNQQQQAAPQYEQNAPGYNSGNTAAAGGYYGANQSYFGGQQTGVQSPANAYRGDNVYQPPAGPPPGKH